MRTAGESTKDFADRKEPFYIPRRSIQLLVLFVLVAWSFFCESLPTELEEELSKTIEFMKLGRWEIEGVIPVGKILSFIPAYFLIQRFQSPKTVLLVSVISIGALMSILSTSFESGINSVMFVEILKGVSSAFLVCGSATILSNWTPKAEFTRSFTFCFGTARLAALLLSEILVPALFVSYPVPRLMTMAGAFAVLLLPLIWFFVHNDPRTASSRLHASEALYIRTSFSAFEPKTIGGAASASEKAASAANKSLSVREVVGWLGFYAGYKLCEISWTTMIPFLLVEITFVDTSLMVWTLMIFVSLGSAIGVDEFLRRSLVGASVRDLQPSSEAMSWRSLSLKAFSCFSLVGAFLIFRFFGLASHAPSVRLLCIFITSVFVSTTGAGVYGSLGSFSRRISLVLFVIGETLGSVSLAIGTVGLKWVLDSSGAISVISSFLLFSAFASSLIWSLSFFSKSSRLSPSSSSSSDDIL